MMASQYGRIATVQFLLGAGAEMEATDSEVNRTRNTA
jgi:hypothetical protein